MTRLTTCFAAAALLIVLGSTAQAQSGFAARGRGFSLYVGSGGHGGHGGYSRYGSYYGNGGHDYQSHLHRTQTPFGSYGWYGNGRHDYRPHPHSKTPWSYRGYSRTWAGPTTSYYNHHSPW